MNYKKSGQAIIEIAIFGAIVIFLMGVILRTHLSVSHTQDHQVKAMKMALQMSDQNSMGLGGKTTNSSRNSSSIIFIEDRLSPDLNKFNTIDRSPMLASGSGSMTNRLMYNVEFNDYDSPNGKTEYKKIFDTVTYNLPIEDIFINGQHIPLTVAAYVFRTLYNSSDTCPNDYMGNFAVGSTLTQEHGPEYHRCLRQQAEIDTNPATPPHVSKCPGSQNGDHCFYGMEVNGTVQFGFNATNVSLGPSGATGGWDLLRNDWDNTCETSRATVLTADCPNFLAQDNVAPGMEENFSWQWRDRKSVV